MRRLLPLVALALLVGPAAAGTGTTKTIGTRGEVLSISADGGNVAVHAALKGDPDCDSGSVWTPATGKVVRFQDRACPGKLAADREYDALTLAGSRAVWTDYDYGNHAYCSGPFVATLAKPTPVDTGACPDEPDNSDMYWEYKADGRLLVARSYVLCEASCEEDSSRTFDDQVTIWSVAGGTKKLLAAKDDTKLLDAHAGRILLRDPARKLLVLTSAGRQVASLPLDAKSAWLNGAGQVSIPSGTALKTYDVATGKLAETCTMAKGAIVRDVENGLAVYSAAGQLHLLTIATGRDRLVAKVKGLVAADLEPAGLFYAYNTGPGAKPGRVAFVASSALPE